MHILSKQKEMNKSKQKEAKKNKRNYEEFLGNCFTFPFMLFICEYAAFHCLHEFPLRA